MFKKTYISRREKLKTISIRYSAFSRQRRMDAIMKTTPFLSSGRQFSHGISKPNLAAIIDIDEDKIYFAMKLPLT